MSLPPWVSSETSNLIKRRNTLMKKAQRNPNEGLLRKVEVMKVEVEVRLNEDQKIFENRIFKNGQFSEIQKYFKGIRKSSQLPSEIYWNDSTAVTNLEKAELFNQFFQSVFTESDYSRAEQNSIPSKIECIDFNLFEIETALQNLTIGKAKGPDGLGNLPLKRLTKCLSPSLKLVFNTIANKHVFPSAWKTSNIIPLFKEGDKQNIENYRSISLLSCISKVLETLIFAKLYTVIGLEISPEQHGFTKNKSTMTQMILYLSELFEQVEQSTLATLYIDFEKAFDKVCHEKLLEKLLSYGIKGGSFKLIESYLLDRKQRVQVGNALSSERQVKSGVPQGSVLGPLFFNVFINDLPKTVMSNCYGYADDYKIVGRNAVTLQLDAARVWKWCNANLMKLNINKSKVLNLKGNCKIFINDQALEQTDSEKDLGIIVTRELTWTANVERRCSKAIVAYLMIKMNIAYETEWSTKKNLYRSYIVPRNSEIKIFKT